MAVVVPRHNPGLEGKSAGIGSEADEARRIEDDSPFRSKLLMNHVAVNTSAPIVKEFEGAVYLLTHVDWNDRGNNKLRMGVRQRCTSSRAYILEKHAIDQTAVLLQIDQPVAIDPNHIANIFLCEIGHARFVKRTLDDDLVRPDTVHLVVHAVATF